VTDVLIGLDVGREDLALAHGILAILSNVDWCLDSASKLELIGLYRDNSDEGHLDDKLLRVLVVKAALLDAPSSTFKEDSLDVGARVETFGNLCRVTFFRYLSVEQTLIERPLTGTASGLEERSQIRLGDHETTEPDDLRLLNFDPVLVLVVASLKVLNPAYQVLLTRWGFK
jgi:hypothetical protein